MRFDHLRSLSLALAFGLGLVAHGARAETSGEMGIRLGEKPPVARTIKTEPARSVK